MPNPTPPFPIERVERAILVIRGEKVMLSTDLAEQHDEWQVGRRYLSLRSMALLERPSVPALESKEAA